MPETDGLATMAQHMVLTVVSIGPARSIGPVLSAAPDPWTFEARPDLWLLLAGMALAYGYGVRALGPRYAPGDVPSVTRRQLVCFSAGLLVLLAAAGWPLDRLGDSYLFSLHMLQFLLMTLVVPPLLLLGTPGWLLRALLGPFWRFVCLLARPIVALALFNLVLVLSHWPAVVALYVASDLVHFAMHTTWVLTGLVFWLPVLSPVPQLRRLAPFGQMVYLFLSSVIPTVPASFLTWSERPIYSAYAAFPRLWGIDAVQDQQAAAAVMKVGGGLLLWTAIAVVFFRWVIRAERSGSPHAAPATGLTAASSNGRTSDGS